MEVLFLVFWGTLTLISNMTALIYIPTSSEQGNSWWFFLCLCGCSHNQLQAAVWTLFPDTCWMWGFSGRVPVSVSVEEKTKPSIYQWKSELSRFFSSTPWAFVFPCELWVRNLASEHFSFAFCSVLLSWTNRRLTMACAAFLLYVTQQLYSMDHNKNSVTVGHA